MALENPRDLVSSVAREGPREGLLTEESSLLLVMVVDGVKKLAILDASAARDPLHIPSERT